MAKTTVSHFHQQLRHRPIRPRSDQDWISLLMSGMCTLGLRLRSLVNKNKRYASPILWNTCSSIVTFLYIDRSSPQLIFPHVFSANLRCHLCQGVEGPTVKSVALCRVTEIPKTGDLELPIFLNESEDAECIVVELGTVDCHHIDRHLCRRHTSWSEITRQVHIGGRT